MRNVRYRVSASRMAGTRRSIIHTSVPVSDCRPAKSTSRPGSANCFSTPPNEKRIEAGCSRCSDGITRSGWQQVLPDAKRQAVLQPLEADLRVVGARGEHDERAEAEPTLERPLRNIGVLDRRPR